MLRFIDDNIEETLSLWHPWSDCFANLVDPRNAKSRGRRRLSSSSFLTWKFEKITNANTFYSIILYSRFRLGSKSRRISQISIKYKF